MILAPNRRAFLDMIGFAEGTITSPATRFHGYDVIVTGIDGKPEVFTDFSRHPFEGGRPSKQINSRGLTSNAAGKYQHMLRDWPHYRALLNLTDFSPLSQDLWAIQLIRERSALPLIDGGRFLEAVYRCSNLWASLPGATYGQPTSKPDALIAAFVGFGGMIV